MQYVYRYISDNQVLYVGITSDMRRRVREHTVDKLRNIQNATIQYFPVESRTDAELIETYLISATDSCKKYNVSKASKEAGTFLKSVTFPWKEYFGRVSADDEPFRIQPEKVIQEKVVYTDNIVYKERPQSLQTQVDKIWENRMVFRDFFEEELEYEWKMIVGLYKLYKDRDDSNLATSIENVLRGMYLHSKRQRCLYKAENAYNYVTHMEYLLSDDDSASIDALHKRDLAFLELKKISNKINGFENSLKKQIGE